MTEVARAHLQLGIRTALVTPAWILGFSFLGVGSLAREAGHPLGAALLSTIIVWAAPAQLILYGSLAGGGLLLAAAIAVALSAIRLLPMTLSVLPYLRRPGQTILTQALMAHFIAATTWVESMRTLPDLTEEGRVPYFLGFSLPLPLAAGLLCLTPIYFTISLTASARTATDWVAIALGLLLAPLAQHLVGRDFDLLVAGIVGGTIAYLVGRRGRIIAA
jgi:predicted branched-subunit amino acid permease